MKRLLCIVLTILIFTCLFEPASAATEVEGEIAAQENALEIGPEQDIGENENGEETVDAVITPTPTPDPGITDGDGGYTATLHTYYDNVEHTSLVGYTINFEWFFGDNTQYRPGLARVSCLLAGIAYERNKLSGLPSADSIDTVLEWFAYHDFDGWESYNLDDYYTDHHVSEMFVGHKSFTYNEETKYIVCVVIRGTNGTLNEWRSNFDLGTTEDFSLQSLMNSVLLNMRL